MKYIVFMDKEVLHILDKEPKKKNVARCDFIPPLNIGEYYEVFNVQEHTEKYTKQVPKEVIKVDEKTGEEVISAEWVDVEKTRSYKTCELLVKQDLIKIKRIRLKQLKDWFNSEYRYYNEKLTRFAALGITEGVIDKVFNSVYLNLNELYLQAEEVREEIQELEAELNI